MALPMEQGIELISKAYEERSNDILMQRWIIHYEKEISFDEFKEKLKTRPIKDTRSKEEILDEAENILVLFRGSKESQ